MKSLLTLIAGFIALLFAGYMVYAVRTTPAVVRSLSLKDRVLCQPPAQAEEPTPFIAQSAPPPVMIRKNIYSLSSAEITSIKTGIAAMKALPVTNPTSWQYQAAIHGTTLANNLPSWNSCQHGTQFFLAWHRMYLYYFERILRAKSGNPNLTLPYWNYQTNPVLPPDYRLNSAANTLYDATRSASINGGGSLPASISTSINNSLNNNIPYFDFQSALEGPHGSVHVAIGGNMGAVNKAALDPVFWLHHTNIDRLWEAWLRKCGGRSNPTSDAAWMNKNYTFFNETGTAVTMTASQVVSTAASLNYRYDFPLMLPCNIVINWDKWKFREFNLLRKPVSINLNQKINAVKVQEQVNDTIMTFVNKNQIKRFNFATTGNSDKVLLKLDDIQVNKLPEGVVEVYLNLPANERPTPESKYFVGVLDLFSLSMGGMHHNMAGKNSGITLDASQAVQAQGLPVAALQVPQLTFIVRGNTVNGQEKATTADLNIRSTNFAVRFAEK